MSKPTEEQTQKTRPVKGKPVEIPVPKREDVERDLRKLIEPERTPERPRGRGD